MLKSALSLLVMAVVSSTSFGVAVVGKDAPAFTLKDGSGTEFSLAKAKGSYVVLEWYNKDCPFVRKHYDSNNMQNLQKKYTEKGVKWFSINSSAKGKEGYLTAEEAAKQMKDVEHGSSTLLIDEDGKVGKAYGAKTTPHMFVIDPKGKVIYAGAIDNRPTADKADVEKATNYVAVALDSEMSTPPKKIDVSSTKAYGCSVKYN
jgi:peroxiredoxin